MEQVYLFFVSNKNIKDAKKIDPFRIKTFMFFAPLCATFLGLLRKKKIQILDITIILYLFFVANKEKKKMIRLESKTFVSFLSLRYGCDCGRRDQP
jgi:hypothetical protein